MKQGERDPLPFTPQGEVTAAQEVYRRMIPVTTHVESSSFFFFACHSAFAMSLGAFAAFPVLGKHVPMHQPPAQENILL